MIAVDSSTAPLPPPELVVFDAMGVLYRWGNDTKHVLLPYLRDLGSTMTLPAVEELYDLASLGQISSADLWAAYGVTADDAAYCARYELTPDITSLVTDLKDHDVALACLSNDLSEWSLILRRQFGLDRLIDRWMISGDIGARKPDPAAFQALTDTAKVQPGAVFFLDDNPVNVVAARALGWQAVVFSGVDAARRELVQRGVLAG